MSTEAIVKESTQRFCFVIPHYCHEQLLPDVLNQIRPLGLDVIVVDDGSPAESQVAIAALERQYEWVRFEKLPQNCGKGIAVEHGLKTAMQLQYTHAIQIDADGQHCVADIPAFLEQARKHPDALISGAPVFGADAPRARLWGRKFTNFWIHLETLSSYIPDGLCGFRVYPVAAALQIFERYGIGKRMDFDADYLVRAAWRGQPILFVPIRVSYGQGGISHFDYLADNVRITIMHTKLVVGMLLRLPVLLPRKIFRRSFRTGPDGRLHDEEKS